MQRSALVLMGHGSRVPGAGTGMEQVVEQLRKEHPIVEACYLERQDPHFHEAFDRCLEQGATRVTVIPYFLHAGLHLQADIPAMLQEEAREHPEVTLVLGKHLGFDDLLVDLVRKRIAESDGLGDVRGLELRSREALAPGGGHHHHHHHHH